MKKVLMILLSAAMIVGLCACNKGTQDDNSGTEQKTAVTDKKIGETSQDELSEIESKAEDSSSDSESKVSQESKQASAEQSDSQTSSKKTENNSQSSGNVKPSEKVVKKLLEEGKMDESYINERVGYYNGRYPDLTQEQMDKILTVLSDFTAVHAPRYAIAVIAGEIDENTPKLTLEDIQSIIEKVKNDSSISYDKKIEKIREEVRKIQIYPDTTFPSGDLQEVYIVNTDSEGNMDCIVVSDTNVYRCIYSKENWAPLTNAEILFD